MFDTFVSVDRRDPLFIGWPDAELSADDRTALAKLLGNLSSLGRAEGWVHAELIDDDASNWHWPAEPNDPNPVPVLCPDPATAFDDEHYPTLRPEETGEGKGKPCRLPVRLPSLALCLDTETITSQKWSAFPGRSG